MVLLAFIMSLQGNRIKEIVNHNHNQCKGSLSDAISCTPIFPCEGIDPLYCHSILGSWSILHVLYLH